jgi:hypothetical protein
MLSKMMLLVLAFPSPVDKYFFNKMGEIRFKIMDER